MKLPIASAACLMTLIATGDAAAQEASGWVTTSSLIEPSQYGDDFRHYDHADPDAPKGGTVNLAVQGTFDSFNPYIIRGTAAAGLAGLGGGLLYDTLLSQSIDEPATSHPSLAEAYTYPDDYSFVIYRLDDDARWHDGEPVTPEDVVWTFDVLTEHSQLYREYYKNVTETEILNETDIKFSFDQTGNRELPQIIGDMPVLPKHWWEGTDADGNARDISQPTLEPPLGSGPYRIRAFSAGASITWERVEDYWGADLGVNLGRNNFDRISYTYFLDATPIWEAFKKGGIQDFRSETRSARWAGEYNFPAFEAGRVTKRAFPTTSPKPMQGFAMNMRRDKFADRRVRQALAHLFDFESINRLQLAGQRTRTDSFFEGGELQASGVPGGRELEILEEFRADLPADLFAMPFENPVGGDRAKNRENQRVAAGLMREAGWAPRDGAWVNAETGEPFTIEILGASETTNIIAGQFTEDLRRFGIDAQIRIVDASQYIARLEEFNFDMTTVVLAQSLSPGNEQRDFWSSAAADSSDSRNMSGIENPVVDALIEKIIFAGDREELVAATRALDRVLLWNHYYIPQWHSADEWIAWWDKFDFVDNQPAYTGVDFQSWWVKPEAMQ
ncbi:MAG: ABC transporter substrate-binding protein [Roseitalea sp.]|jgi:microcin C transport system substrate-binding protein|nr:ABC transporter substrate-binding protein [Roseitalea sp.]MBO6723846.1 ABC transporter substrate-binding protein [Roseitalea sp.]MBO6745036.1 ABC transporter substrate-binding protein [Roseitalea sp.]